MASFIKEKDSLDAWCEGIDAYKFKYKKTECPYGMDKLLLRTAWIDGWEEAEAVD